MKLSTQTVSCRCKKKITESKSFTAGFGKAIITPSDELLTSIHLGSHGDEESRIATGKLDDIYALTVALTDKNDNTLLLIVTDLTNANRGMTKMVREAVSEEYGIPAANVMVAGTHNHSSIAWPKSSYNWDETHANVKYKAEWLAGVMESVAAAMEDRSVATMQIGSTETDGLNFSRRYWREDGTMIGGGPSSWWPTSTAARTSHESEADPEMQMVRFVREDEKDILITQWQSHACYISGNTSNENHYKLSAEWPGIMRDKVEDELGVHCIYFQGASANLSETSKLSGETKTSSYIEHGEALADCVVNAWNAVGTFEIVNTGTIKTHQTEIEAEQGTHSGTWTKSYNPQVNTISIGDMAIVTLPQELFDLSGQQIKASTAHKMTLIMGYSDCTAGYLAPAEYFENGGYEVYNTAYRADGTAELIVNHYLKKLEEIK